MLLTSMNGMLLPVTNYVLLTITCINGTYIIHKFVHSYELHVAQNELVKVFSIMHSLVETDL